MSGTASSSLMIPDDDERLDADAQAIRDAVNACRKAMIDLPLNHKNVVLNELHRWLVAEAGGTGPFR